MPPDTPADDTALKVEFDRLLAGNPLARRLSSRVIEAERLRGRSPDTSRRLSHFLLDQVLSGRRALERAAAEQDRLRATFERLTAPPWHPATFLERVETGSHQVVLVSHGASRRVVSVADDVDLDAVVAGDEVYLGPELNLVVARSPTPTPGTGETAILDRYTGDGRVVVRSRDEEFVALASGPLLDEPARSGDLVRIDRTQGIAYERLERSASTHLFLEDTPSVTFADIGGLDEQLERVTVGIRMRMTRPELSARYGSRPVRSIMLVGPPGVGKTMIAQAFANWLASLSPHGRSRFMHVPPGKLHSMWYSQTEANYRDAFRTAREAAAQEPGVPVVMFFDEVDAIGAARGQGASRIDDRILPAFMTELSGLEDRGDVLVISATNRQDALDPAAARPDRLGDLVVEIPRPNRAAGRQILAKHLPATTPLHGAVPVEDTREALLDAAVARIYGPNGLGELASLAMRDGTRRGVEPRDLVSGAVLARIARDAIERGQHREFEGGQPGVGLHDVVTAVDTAFETASAVLTPANSRWYVLDLAPDVDVVRIDRPTRPVPRVQQYLRLA